MTPQMRHYPAVEALIDIFAEWLQHRREMAETCNCDSRELGRVAQDLGVSVAELETLVSSGPHAADELPKLMGALNLDPVAIARTHRTVMNDMARVCSHCANKQQCRDQLKDGTAAQSYADYCGNADTLQSLGPRDAA